LQRKEPRLQKDVIEKLTILFCHRYPLGWNRRKALLTALLLMCV
jgi:hypothetical protein